MLSILRKARLKDKEMRILMLGLDNAGKTTIVKKIMNEDVNSVSPTLGFIIKTIEYNGLLVFKNKSDVPGSMSEDEIREVGDGSGAAGTCWRANADGVQGLRLDAIKTHKWHIMTCSAMTGLNLQQGLEWVVQDAKARLFLY
ncbi:hypothetical protein CFE70_004140 [Pyrenophora teres f. teres 0-1]